MKPLVKLPSILATLLLLCFAWTQSAAGAETPQRRIEQCHADLFCVEGLAYSGHADIWIESFTDHPLVLALAVRSGRAQEASPEIIRLALDLPERRQVFTVALPSKRDWQVAWSLTYHHGSDEPASAAQHDDTALYRLPYGSGSAYEVIQSYDGGFTHKGALRFAVDWALPSGTPVLAARDGVVVGLWEESDRGGADPALRGAENFLWVQHDDGSVAHYLHLQRDGALVALGDSVVAGQVIARSGATGYATQPHLHFHVSTPAPGPEAFMTFPLQFLTAGGVVIKPEVGRSYRAL